MSRYANTMKKSLAYIETLRTYFQCNKDYVEMATALRIHRNTVFYRMNKLKDIFGLDLSDFRKLLIYPFGVH